MIIPEKDKILIDDNGQLAPAAVRSLHDNIMIPLNKHYPKWEGSWHIAIDVEGGIVQIRNLLLSGQMGFVMRIIDVDSGGKKVLNYVGELFERYKVTRKKAIDLRETIEDIKRNNIGEAVHDGGQ